MAFTAKQERNGTAIGADGHNSAVANEGPMPAIPIGEAMAAGMTLAVQGHSLFDSPAGAGVDGHMVGPDGPMFEWDSGLAINDVEGGGSG